MISRRQAFLEEENKQMKALLKDIEFRGSTGDIIADGECVVCGAYLSVGSREEGLPGTHHKGCKLAKFIKT
jgi:hypothetical protein